MKDLLRSEWLKVTSTRMVLGLTITALAFTALNVIVLVAVSGQPGAPTLDEESAVRSIFATAGSASVIALILGVLGMTTEYRHMTITSTFLASPRRGRVVTAKMLAYFVLGGVVGLLTSVFTIALASVALLFRDHAPVPWSNVAQIGVAVVIAFALYGVLGVSVGALIRNQVAAIVVSLVWVLLVEALVVAFLPKVGKWLPGGAANAMLQATSFDAGSGSFSAESPFLPPWAGGVLLLAYAVAFALVATRLTVNRDIT